MEVYLFGCKDTTLHVAKFLNTKGAAVNLVTIDRELAAKNQVAGFLNLLDYPTLFKSIYVAKSYSLTDSQDDKFFSLTGSMFLVFVWAGKDLYLNMCWTDFL